MALSPLVGRISAAQSAGDWRNTLSLFRPTVLHPLGNASPNHHLDSRGSARERAVLQMQEATMFISDVLRTKGHHVERVHPDDTVELAVRKLAEHRIGALVVEDRWMKPVGIFSERDFIKAI